MYQLLIGFLDVRVLLKSGGSWM